MMLWRAIFLLALVLAPIGASADPRACAETQLRIVADNKIETCLLKSQKGELPAAGQAACLAQAFSRGVIAQGIDLSSVTLEDVQKKTVEDRQTAEAACASR